MRFRHILSISLLAVLATGLVVLAQWLNQLWIAVAALSGAFAGGGIFLHLRNNHAWREIEVLREHLEGTRQHAALLARHTRELRETLIAGDGDPAEARAKANDFATLSSLVRDLADGVAELDKRAEAAEYELADIRRARAAANARATSSPSWVQPPKPPVASSMPQSAAPAAAMPAPVRAPLAEPRAGRSEMTARLDPAPVAPPAAPPLPIVDEHLPARDFAAPPRPAGLGEPPRAVRQLVAAAIAADRFDLYLQRVVGLPQRRIRGYDISLRPDGSDLKIPNFEIRQAVEAVGHQLAFDRKLMIQAVRLARVFEQRDRDVVLFADISQRFLMSEAAFDDLDALVADVPQAPQRIVLCLPQRFFKKAVAFEHEALRTLGKMGFSFMMRDIDDLDIDPARLAQMGVRWLRMSADGFLGAAQTQETLLDVATADFVALLARRKLSFMVENVTDEARIADLIDLSVEFAQGIAFAPPQAVRADVLDTPPAAEPTARAPAEAAAERRSLRDLARRA